METYFNGLTENKEQDKTYEIQKRFGWRILSKFVNKRK